MRISLICVEGAFSARLKKEPSRLWHCRLLLRGP